MTGASCQPRTPHAMCLVGTVPRPCSRPKTAILGADEAHPVRRTCLCTKVLYVLCASAPGCVTGITVQVSRSIQSDNVVDEQQEERVSPWLAWLQCSMASCCLWVTDSRHALCAVVASGGLYFYR